VADRAGCGLYAVMEDGVTVAWEHAPVAARVQEHAGVGADEERSPSGSREQEFRAFVQRVEPGLRRALVAAFGAEVGREACADALGWAWEHWPKARKLANAGGYLYRVGRTSARRGRRWVQVPMQQLHDEQDPDAEYEPSLRPALARLSERQRAAIVLVHGFAYSQVEAASLLHCSVSSLRNHLDRGMAKLRKEMGA